MSDETKVNNLDLTNCDKEKIHQINEIQDHGALIVFTTIDFKIRFLSENASKFFEQPEGYQEYIGKKITDLIPQDVYHAIQNKVRSFDSRPGNHLSFSSKGQKHFDLYLYRIDENMFGVEVELNSQDINPQDAQERLNTYLQEMQQSKTLEEVSTLACRAVRYLSGFERVMIYRFFAPSMYGEVIAEDRVANAHSFLHHRFPATDIPKPARDLYFRNRIRFILDSSAPQVSLFPKAAMGKAPLDLSDSRLRGVSKIHLEYLKNMGVKGSFSIAIIVEGKLWGIISCHHSEAQYVSHLARSYCLTVANSLALCAPLLEQNKIQKGELSFFEGLHTLYSELKVGPDPLDKLFRMGDKVNELFNCSGFALISSRKSDLSGFTPRTSDLKALHKWVLDHMQKENKTVFYTESLGQIAPEFAELREQVSGIMCLRPNGVDDTVLMFFRPQYLQTVLWGGDPRKNIEARNYQGQINPRASFSTWTEVIKDSSLPWANFEVGGLESFKDLIFDSLVNKEALIAELSDRLQSRKQ